MMTGDDFKAWRKRLGLTQAEAAAILGITRQGLQKRESGMFAITPETDFACRYLEEHPEAIEGHAAEAVGNAD
jgi:transcriptional regulator with XRE-family HTH domain